MSGEKLHLHGAQEWSARLGCALSGIRCHSLFARFSASSGNRIVTRRNVAHNCVRFVIGMGLIFTSLLFDGGIGPTPKTVRAQISSVTSTPPIPANLPIISTQNAEQLSELAAPHGPDYWVTGLSFSPDGRLLAALRLGSTVYIWDTTTWATLAALTLGPSELGWGDVQFSPDGTLLAATNDVNSNILLWDVKTALETKNAKPKTTLLYPGNAEEISLSFRPDGKQIATLDYLGNLRFWDVATGKQIDMFQTGDCGPNKLLFSPTGKTLAYTTLGTIHLLNTLTKTQQTIPADNPVLAFNPDGSILAFEKDSKLRLWNINTTMELFALGSDNFTGIGAIAFSPDGTIVAAGSTWNYLILWDVRTGKKLRVVDETGGISAMTFSPNGTMIATGHAGSGITQAVDVWGIN